LTGCFSGNYENALCSGNIETFDKKIIKYNVDYRVSYLVNSDEAKARFAGREIDANATKGKTYNGYWMQNKKGNIYFSYLPDDGGQIKVEFESGEWFSGVCHKTPN